MGVTDLTAKVTYSGNDATTAFTFNFKLYAKSQAEIYLISSLGVETLQTITTHYTVALNTGEGGTITMITAPATGQDLQIRSNIPLTQPDAIDTGPMPNRVIEQMSDRITLLTQQLNEIAARSPQFRKTSSSSTPLLPEPEDGKHLTWNAAGDITNVTALFTGATVIDEDNMVSDSDTAVPTQQSTKAYADTKVANVTLTNKGDILAATAPSTLARLGVGVNGQVLTADSTQSTGLKWAGLGLATKTTTYPMTTADNFIFGDTSSAAFTLTLPTAVGNTGKVFEIKYSDSGFANALTVDGNGSETVGGSANQKLHTLGETLKVISNGTNFDIISRTIPSVWVAYTPAATWSTNTTMTGFWRRVGDSMDLKFMATLAGAPDSAT